MLPIPSWSSLAACISLSTVCAFGLAAAPPSVGGNAVQTAAVSKPVPAATAPTTTSPAPVTTVAAAAKGPTVNYTLISTIDPTQEKEYPGLADALKNSVTNAVNAAGGTRFRLAADDAKEAKNAAKGYKLEVRIKSVDVKSAKQESTVKLACDLLLTEMPGRILRMNTSAVSAISVNGSITKRDAADLAKDAVAECAPALANDFVQFTTKKR